MRIELDDFLQPILVHLVAHVGVALLGGGARGCISFLNLPQNVGGTPCGFRQPGVSWETSPRVVDRAVAQFCAAFTGPRGSEASDFLVGRRRPSGSGRRWACSQRLFPWPASIRRSGGGVSLAPKMGVSLSRVLPQCRYWRRRATMGRSSRRPPSRGQSARVHFLRARVRRDVEPGDAQGRCARAGHGLLQFVLLLSGRCKRQSNADRQRQQRQPESTRAASDLHQLKS